MFSLSERCDEYFKTCSALEAHVHWPYEFFNGLLHLILIAFLEYKSSLSVFYMVLTLLPFLVLSRLFLRTVLLALMVLELTLSQCKSSSSQILLPLSISLPLLSLSSEEGMKTMHL